MTLSVPVCLSVKSGITGVGLGFLAIQLLTYESTVKRQRIDQWFQKAASFSTRNAHSDKQDEPTKGRWIKR